MGSNRDRRIDVLHDRLWSVGISAYRHTASPGHPAGLTIPLDRPGRSLLIWPSGYPRWTFFQVAHESVDEREQDLVGVVLTFAPHFRDDAA